MIPLRMTIAGFLLLVLTMTIIGVSGSAIPEPEVSGAQMTYLYVEHSTYEPLDTIKLATQIHNSNWWDPVTATLMVDIADPQGMNVFQGRLVDRQQIDALGNHIIGYTSYFTLPAEPVEGWYSITAGLYEGVSPMTRVQIDYGIQRFYIDVIEDGSIVTTVANREVYRPGDSILISGRYANDGNVPLDGYSNVDVAYPTSHGGNVINGRFANFRIPVGAQHTTGWVNYLTAPAIEGQYSIATSLRDANGQVLDGILYGVDTFRVEHLRDAEVASGSATLQEYIPNSIVRFSSSARNTGTVAITVEGTVDLVDPSGGVLATANLGTLTLAIGQTRAFPTIDLHRLPSDASPGTYSLRTTLSSGGTVLDRVTPSDTFIVLPVYTGAIDSASLSATQASPGESLTAAVTISNTGTGDLDVVLTVALKDPAGTEIAVVTTQITSLPVGTSWSDPNLSLYSFTPGDCPSSGIWVMDVRVDRTGGSRLATAARADNIELICPTNVSIASVGWVGNPANYSSGEEMTLEVSVSIDGPGNLVGGYLNVDLTDPVGNLVVTENQTGLTGNPGESLDFNLSILVVPYEILGGTYSVSIEIGTTDVITGQAGLAPIQVVSLGSLFSWTDSLGIGAQTPQDLGDLLLGDSESSPGTAFVEDMCDNAVGFEFSDRWNGGLVDHNLVNTTFLDVTIMEATVHLEPTLRVSACLGSNRPVEMVEIKLASSYRFDLSVNVSAEYLEQSSSSYHQSLASYLFAQPLPFFPFGVVETVDLSVDYYLDWNLRGAAMVEVSVRLSGNMSLTFSYDPDLPDIVVTSSHFPDPSILSLDPTLSAALDLNISVTPNLDIKLFGLAGPSLSTNASISVAARLDGQSIDCYVNGSLVAAGSLEMGIFALEHSVPISDHTIWSGPIGQLRFDLPMIIPPTTANGSLGASLAANQTVNNSTSVNDTGTNGSIDDGLTEVDAPVNQRDATDPVPVEGGDSLVEVVIDEGSGDAMVPQDNLTLNPGTAHEPSDEAGTNGSLAQGDYLGERGVEGLGALANSSDAKKTEVVVANGDLEIGGEGNDELMANRAEDLAIVENQGVTDKSVGVDESSSTTTPPQAGDADDDGWHIGKLGLVIVIILVALAFFGSVIIAIMILGGVAMVFVLILDMLGI